jgi:hypothetical protein
MSFLRRCISDLQAGIVATVTVLRGLWRGNLDEIRGQLKEINRKALSHRRDILFRGIGAALSAWSKMEEIMVVIAMQLLRTSPEKAGVVMYSIINFNTWLSVIHDLFEHDEDFRNFKGRFDKIGERIRRIKDQRDQLAHHSVRITDEPPLLKASKFDARPKSKKQPPMSLDEVQDFTDKVLIIAEDLHELSTAMRAWRRSSRRRSRKLTGGRHPQSNSQ